MSTNNSTPPNAIDLALDALREFEKFYDIACNDDRPVTRELAAKNADFERSRSAILAHVAIAQAIVALAKGVDNGLLSQIALVDADNALLIDRLRSMNQALEGDNAALTDRLHQCEPIEVPE